MATPYEKGKELEQDVLNLLYDVLPSGDYLIDDQRMLKNNRPADIYVARRKQAGIRFIIECKNYTVTELRKSHINQALDNKRACRAMRAFVVVREETQISPSVLQYAYDSEVEIAQMGDRSQRRLLGWLDDLRTDMYIRSLFKVSK